MGKISSRRVPHIGPLSSPIFILGEAPGRDEDLEGEPFVGQSGKFLTQCLSFAGISREDCRIGNVCNYRPDRNDFHILHGTPQLEEGQSELQSYLSAHSPRIIIALGNEALRCLRNHANIADWRGSVLPRGEAGWIIPSYHPAAALRDGTLAPQIIFDIEKAVKVLNNGYTPPVHDFIIDPDELQFQRLLHEVSSAPWVAADIESVRDTQHILCIGFAVSKERAFCLKNHYPLGHGCDPEFKRRVEEVFAASNGLVFHNGGFDTAMLELNDIHDRGKFTYDTMLAQRVLQPELPIGLDFCASIYTDEPYYKGDGKETGKRIPQTLWTYNCKDCIVTYQTREKQEALFSQDILLDKDKDFIFSRIPLMQEFQRNGMLVDEERRSQLKAATQLRLARSQKIVEMATGYSLNFRAHAQVKELLYTVLKLPHRTNKDGKLSSAEDAIVSLLHYIQGQIDDKKSDRGKAEWVLKLHTLRAILDIRGNEKLISSYLDTRASDDGRIRSSYYPAGTDTGRWSSGSFVDGTGLNAQTLPRELIELLRERKIYVDGSSCALCIDEKKHTKKECGDWGYIERQLEAKWSEDGSTYS